MNSEIPEEVSDISYEFVIKMRGLGYKLEIYVRNQTVDAPFLRFLGDISNSFFANNYVTP